MREESLKIEATGIFAVVITTSSLCRLNLYPCFLQYFDLLADYSKKRLETSSKTGLSCLMVAIGVFLRVYIS